MTKIKLKILNELCGGDAEFVSSMLKTYIEETSEELNLLEEAFKNNDNKAIVFWAHKIKTSFHLLGLDQLSAVATDLEEKAKNIDLAPEKLQQDLNFICQHAGESIEQAKKLIEEI